MKTTMVILTRNRCELLKKNIEFCMLQNEFKNLEVFILDNSDNVKIKIEIEAFCSEKGFNYYYYDYKNDNKNSYSYSYSYNRRLKWVADKINTETLFLMDDEDLINLKTLFECVNFLEHNRDYAMCAGKYKYCRISTDKMLCMDTYITGDIADEYWQTRLWRHVFFYRAALLYSVFSTKNFKKAVYSICDEFLSISEVIFTSAMIVQGKYKVIDDNYIIRTNYHHTAYLPFSAYAFSQNDSREDIGKTLKNHVLALLYCLDDHSEKTISEVQNIYAAFIATTFIADLKLVKSFYTMAVEKNFSKDIDDAFCFLDREENESTKNQTYIYMYHLDQLQLKKDDKIAIYGAGTLGEHFYSQLNGYNIVCFIDMNANQLKAYLGKPVVLPQNILDFEVDKVIIANDEHEDEIIENLMNYKISIEKIIKIQRKNKSFSVEEIYNFCFEN